ncbi:hypothetical protein GCM10010231_54750 [Streptomyces sindenensis]|nr:hypothetical protein GCM10010231_54750 [Streptomyces sindenensis]
MDDGGLGLLLRAGLIARPPRREARERLTVRHKLLAACAPPLTGWDVVHRIITDLAVLDVTPAGLLLREAAPGVTADQVRAATGAEPTVAHDLRTTAQVA